MSRNSVGTYALPYPQVQSGTTISTSWANGTLADLAAEITSSLDRNGRGDMLAPLRVPNGSAALPSLAFTNDTACGLFLNAASDVRLTVASTARQTWTTTLSTISTPLVCSSTLAVTGATTITGALTVSDGLTVTRSTANTAGATVTGNGTGAGLAVTGGGSGATGNAITATGAIVATSAALPTSGAGPSTSYGFTVAAIGTTSGNNYPLMSVGTNIPASNSFTLGLRAKNKTTATSWTNVDLGFTYDVGATVGAGGSFYIGDGGAKLSIGTSGTQVAATATVRSPALTLTNGDLSLDGVANPNSNVAVKNGITPSNIPKAWATIATGGSLAVSSGFNITSLAAVSTNNIRVTLAQAMANTNYAPIITTNNANTLIVVTNITTTTFDIAAATATTGAAINLNSVAASLYVVVFGLQ